MNTETPRIGQAATYSINGSPYGGTVVDVQRNGRTVVIAQGTIRPSRTVFTKRSDGSYRLQGEAFGFLKVSG